MDSSFLGQQISAFRMTDQGSIEISATGFVSTPSFTSDGQTAQHCYSSHYTAPLHTFSEANKSTSHVPYQYPQSLANYNFYGRDNYTIPQAFDETYTASAVDLSNLQGSAVDNSLGVDLTIVNSCSEMNLSLKDLQKQSPVIDNNKSQHEQFQTTRNNNMLQNSDKPNPSGDSISSQPVINVPFFTSNNPDEELKATDLSILASETSKLTDTSLTTEIQNQPDTTDLCNTFLFSNKQEGITKGCVEEMNDDINFTCGGCLRKYPTICILHSHMKDHGSNGSFFYSSSTMTAFPRFESCNRDTQTEDESVEHHPKLRTKRTRKRAFVDDTNNNENIKKAKKKGGGGKSKQAKVSEAAVMLGKDGSAMKSDRSVQTLDKVGKRTASKKTVESAKKPNKPVKIPDQESDHVSEMDSDSELNESITGFDDQVDAFDPDESGNDGLDTNTGSDTDDYTPDEDIKINVKAKKVYKQKLSDEKVKFEKNRNKKNVQAQTKISKRSKKKNGNSKYKVDKTMKGDSGIEADTSENVNEVGSPLKSNCTIKAKDADAKLADSENKMVNGQCKKNNTSTNKNRQFECQVCFISFEKKWSLRNHINSEHSDLEHICTSCSKNCSNADELLEHKETVHKYGKYKCELCDKILSNKSMLDGHYLLHSGVKQFSCTICVPKREFTRKCQLKMHMETHSDVRNLQCEICGKSFNARYLMFNHMRHCSGRKPHKCRFCEMAFVSNHCLQRHVRTHTGEKPYVCEVCAFASSSAASLTRHMRTHTGEKPFECKYCQQSFASRGAMRKHIRIHTQEKPYKCSYCTKAFTQKWNLKTHERQHTGETPYKCHVCGVGYKQNVLLKTHLTTHFGGSKGVDISQPGTDISQPGTDISQSGTIIAQPGTDVSQSGTIIAQPGTDISQAGTIIVQPSNDISQPCTDGTAAVNIRGNVKSVIEAHPVHLVRQPQLDKHFKCSSCPKSFSQRRHLKAHERQHTSNERNDFRCNMCDVEFKDQSQFKYHQETHHHSNIELANQNSILVNLVNVVPVSAQGNQIDLSQEVSEVSNVLETSLQMESKQSSSSLQPGSIGIHDLQNAAVLANNRLLACLSNGNYPST